MALDRLHTSHLHFLGRALGGAASTFPPIRAANPGRPADPATQRSASTEWHRAARRMEPETMRAARLVAQHHSDVVFREPGGPAPDAGPRELLRAPTRRDSVPSLCRSPAPTVEPLSPVASWVGLCVPISQRLSQALRSACTSAVRVSTLRRASSGELKVEISLL